MPLPTLKIKNQVFMEKETKMNTEKKIKKITSKQKKKMFLNKSILPRERLRSSELLGKLLSFDIISNFYF